MRELDILKGNIDSTGKMTGQEIWAAINQDSQVLEALRLYPNSISIYQYWKGLEGNSNKTLKDFWKVLQTTGGGSGGSGSGGSSNCDNCNEAWNRFYKEISGEEYKG